MDVVQYSVPGRERTVCVASSIVPVRGALVYIEKEWFRVNQVAFAVDVEELDGAKATVHRAVVELK